MMSIGLMLIAGGLKGIFDDRKRKRRKLIEHTPVYS